MSVDSAKAAELLASLYVEREESRWLTVARCLDGLMNEQVVSHSGLASLALDLVDQDSSFYVDIIRRAQRINGRVGRAGHLEARKLAVASIELALSNSKYNNLAAHTSRIGFNRERGKELDILVKRASIRTKTAINQLQRKKKKFKVLSDPTKAEDFQSALKDRDEFFHPELLHRDYVHAVTLSCIAGQSCPWEAICLILGPHYFPYPYGYELIASQACLSMIADDGQVILTKLPTLPEQLRVTNTVNYPILSFITLSQNHDPAPKHAAKAVIPLPDFACQLLLEIVFLRLETS